MKAESGSWFYIILSIVFLIISAIGKNKKKTASPSPVNDDYEPEASVPTERKWTKSFEDILTEVMDLPQQQEVINRPGKEVVENKVKEEADSLEVVIDESFTYDAPENIKMGKTAKLAPVFNLNASEKEIDEPVFKEGEFDIRQGIIYAEILNRKYF